MPTLKPTSMAPASQGTMASPPMGVRRSVALGCTALMMLCWHGSAAAQVPPPAGPQISLQGSMGDKAALLVIDGEVKTVQVGQSVRGVKLLAVNANEARIELEGRPRVLQMGGAPVKLIDSSAPSSAAKQIVLTAGSGGHFNALGTINGKTVQFMVDTGATAIAISEGEADRIGLRFRDGRKVQTQTANGLAAAHLITLSSVRIGEVEVHGVDAIVVPAPMSQVLLGNTFLSRFQMKRDNDQLVLTQRF